ncbi:GlsB/YeaQ/YmgE family stress response membrane protein [[Mycobacterium] burgundiense]|uniref:GlsB/YeaQ/YmgE family stress response membrane protein n=1 Tax=[Mycobacterium] burgundiense TaxID=3064286 RepID=A0ABN9NHK2_9MYCO|nr:GlsB/YeaQ/YmgE family stress response membrane protein [Mycolicibacterium sp. MU0053]CAJ1504837.1 GlsB/YeaQ/YmgE family stress response membrane protein [Mycolicibacterium sp. MU0053]
MTVTGVITAILIGAVIGVLARLILPGKQAIGMVLTVVVGIVSALIGTWLAQAMGISTNTGGVDWLELLVQLVVAVIGVALVAAVMGRRQRSGLARR